MLLLLISIILLLLSLFSFFCCDTYLSFLLVEVIDDDTDEEIEGEEGAEYDEDDKVQVHVEVDFSDGLLLHLKTNSFINQLVTVTCL